MRSGFVGQALSGKVPMSAGVGPGLDVTYYRVLVHCEIPFYKSVQPYEFDFLILKCFRMGTHLPSSYEELDKEISIGPVCH
jgi:hypothetical protein